LRYCGAGADAGILFEAKRQMSDSKVELNQKNRNNSNNFG
jgi:hypothetical protein